MEDIGVVVTAVAVLVEAVEFQALSSKYRTKRRIVEI